MATIELQCPVEGCVYCTPNVSEQVACTLLNTHATVHMKSNTAATGPQRGPKLERPIVDIGVNQEEWNVFQRRWDVFVQGSSLDPAACSTQLFQCAGETLGDSLLKSDPAIVTKSTVELLDAMKNLAVIAVATCVIRADLMSLKQDRDERFRTFAARVRGKAETCGYSTTCTCARIVDFTDTIARDVLLSGIADTDIRREMLGLPGILDKPVNEIISLVESKEMARNALPSSAPSSAAGISSFKHNKKAPERISTPQKNHTIQCPDCKKPFVPFSEGRSGWNSKPHRQCIECYRLNRSRRRPNRNDNEKPGEMGAIFAQVSSIRPTNSSLSHRVFSKGQWRRSRFMDHPTVKLRLHVQSSDFKQFRRKCPNVSPTTINALADSGAQSCLWSFKEFTEAGFSSTDLIPMPIDLVAANKSPISIEGALPVRLQGTAADGKTYSCATIAYVSKQAEGFYLSMETMMDLSIITRDFPNVASLSPPCTPATPQNGTQETMNAGSSSPSDSPSVTCSCQPRTLVPELPKELPFECKPENNDRMKQWLLDYFTSSTFNTCPHQPLPHMTGPPVEIHVKPDATPKAVHTPASIPVHWQKQVHEDLLRDEALGVIEQVPYGEPVTWCHRMVVTRKHDGTPRRTVNLSPLNKHDRETFASETPFHLARRIPSNTWKTVSDAWNGFHSVPRESDRHLTTFITPFGRWRYRTTPQ